MTTPLQQNQNQNPALDLFLHPRSRPKPRSFHFHVAYWKYDQTAACSWQVAKLTNDARNSHFKSKSGGLCFVFCFVLAWRMEMEWEFEVGWCTVFRTHGALVSCQGGRTVIQVEWQWHKQKPPAPAPAPGALEHACDLISICTNPLQQRCSRTRARTPSH